MKEYKIPQVKLSYVSDYSVEHPQVKQSKDLVPFIRSTFDEGDIEYREFFKVVYLNRANKIIGFHTISEGGTAATVVDVKMIFAGALLANAHSIVLCHNHPSGNLRPSCQDDSITVQVNKAGTYLGISVLDHIIVAREGYFSYKDEGRL